MKIRAKVMYGFITLVVILSCVVGITLHQLILPQFETLEKAQLEQNLNSVENAIKQEAFRLKNFALDWGKWDDTYDFMQSGNKNFIETNMIDSLLTDLEMDMLFLVQPNGEVSWGHIEEQDSRKTIYSQFLPTDKWPASHPFLKQQSSPGQGILISDLGPVIYGIQKITNSEGNAESRGVIVFGRFLHTGLLELLREQTLVPFDIRTAPLAESGINITFADNSEAISTQRLAFINSDSQQLELSLKSERLININAQNTIHYVLIINLLAGLVLAFSLYLFLSHHILIPIHQLNRLAESFGKNRHKEHFFTVKRKDEIGTLFTTFKDMTDKIVTYQHRLQREKENYQAASLTDQLTGLKNRRYLNDVLYKRLNQERNDHLLVMLVDQDHFKQVNDNYGHDIGDTVLLQLANIFISCSRKGDDVIRYGGEEFLFVCHDLKGEEALAVVERLCSSVESYQFGESSNSFSMTCSIGFVSITTPLPVSEADMEKAITVADKNLYEAKNNGRNGWVGIEGDISDISTESHRLKTAINTGKLNKLNSADNVAELALT